MARDCHRGAGQPVDLPKSRVNGATSMTAEQRLILDLGDVLAIRIDCAKCGTAVIIKPTEWKQAPFTCPTCQAPWELPHTPESGLSALQRLGTGIALLEQARTAKSGPAAPYKVRLEIRDPLAQK